MMLAGLLVAASAPAGCFRIQTASPYRLQPVSVPEARPTHPTHAPDSVWPDRWTATDRMGAIVPIEGPLSAWIGVRLGPEHYLRGGPEDSTDAEAVAQNAGATTGYQYVLEGPGSFIFERATDGSRGRSTSSDPAEMFKFVSGRSLGTIQSITVVRIERTWMAYYDAATDDTRGLLVLVPGLFGVPEPVDDRFVEMCRQDGWAVLRLLAPPSRFTARATFTIDPLDLGSSARAIARELGDRAAETAYAVDAGVEHVHELRPDLADATHVLVGMSGGAIAAPTVNARTPARYDAVVLIAGGCNFLLTNEYSNYADWVQAIQYDWGEREPTRAERRDIMEKLSKEYLAQAPLDGYQLARLLRDRPVLMLHGKVDRAVPAQYGEELWERLGKPERWVFPVGHELLFLTLNAQTARILDWVDRQVETGAAADAATGVTPYLPAAGAP
jgi:pimeloyl-ACP methyl ester carboxylesterase